jgi:hypothetical protein
MSSVRQNTKEEIIPTNWSICDHVPEIRIAHHVQFVTPVCHYWAPLSLCRIGLYILRQIDVVASLSLRVASPHNFSVIVLYLYCTSLFFMPFILCVILRPYCIISLTVSPYFCHLFYFYFLIFVEGTSLFLSYFTNILRKEMKKTKTLHISLFCILILSLFSTFFPPFSLLFLCLEVIVTHF